MLWLYAALLIAQADPAPAPASDRPTWAQFPSPTDAIRCTRRLRNPEISLLVRCQLSSRGAPQDCTLVRPESVTPQEWTAVQCMVSGYRFKYPDGRPTLGATVDVPITLQTR